MNGATRKKNLTLSFLKVDSISRCSVKSSRVKFYFILYYNIAWDMCSQLEILKKGKSQQNMCFLKPLEMALKTLNV